MTDRQLIPDKEIEQDERVICSCLKSISIFCSNRNIDGYGEVFYLCNECQRNFNEKHYMKEVIKRPIQDQSIRAIVYEYFVGGKSIEEAVSERNLKYNYVQNLFTEFFTMKISQNENRLKQIQAIEITLFEAISKKYDEKIINQLQETYSKFLL